MAMKKKLIKILGDAAGEIVSGPEISSLLSISRVAVWKHIKQLKEMGYDIVSSSRGYALDAATSDLPMPLYFTKRKESIHYYPTLTSTMDKARELARSGDPHMSVVIAEEQQNGRGRLNRKWFSQKGGLWFTLILRPHLPPPLAYQVNFAASICLTRTIQQMFDMDVSVKWPNDILFKGKKLAGLLSEMETRGDMISFVNIGIGLNANNYPGEVEPNAVSIRNFMGKSIHRRTLLSNFLDHFEETLHCHIPGPADHDLKRSGVQKNNAHRSNSFQRGDNQEPTIISQWKEMTSTIGKKVTIETHGEIFQGTAMDVDESGALVIQQDDGIEKKIIYGDCFHQKLPTIEKELKENKKL